MAKRLGLVIALVLATAVAATGPVTAAPARAAGSIGVRLLDVPAELADDPRARLYVVDRLAPGAQITRRIEVSNSTNAVVRVALYAAAATVADGTFRVAAGRTPNALSTWTDVRPGLTDVPAGGTATAVVTIRVPADAPPGEQYGVVWAEARSSPSSGNGVTQVSRVGIRQYVSIGSGNAPAADFSIGVMTAARRPDGAPVLQAQVRNTGGRALDLSGTLRLSAGPGGLSAGPFPADLGTTLGPGDTGTVTVVLDRLVPAGPWKVRLTLRSGLVEHTAAARLTFPAVGQTVEVSEVGGRHWLPPLVALVLLLSSGALLVRRHLRLARSDGQPPG